VAETRAAPTKTNGSGGAAPVRRKWTDEEIGGVLAYAWRSAS
jgi:hypothetical protein